MQRDETPPADQSSEDEIIDHLYDVAVDPTRYETLLDHWEALIAPRRATANADANPSLGLSSFEGHFRRADRMLSHVISDPKSDQTDPQVLLKSIDRAAGMIVDAGLVISHVNTAASVALGIAPGASVRRLALGPGEADILAQQIKTMLLGNSAEPQVMRVRSALADRVILMHLRLVRPPAAPAFVVVLASELGWPHGFTEMLREAFDLTKAEVDVTRALAEGHALSDIAEQRSRSIETIRAQVKSILSKTETRSQAELVRLTLSTMDMASYTDGAAQELSDTSIGFATLEQRPFQTMRLPDGRRLDFLILGNPNGRPVFYFPLDYGLVRWPASAEADAARRGLQIVVPVRPGYGASDPVPKRAPYTAQIVEDMVALLDHLGIAKAPILTLGADSFFATSLHAAYPERVSALICCSGVLPLTRPEQYERMDKWHRFILAGARYTPHLLPFMVKAGFALANRLGKRGFIHAVYGKSPADIATFEIPEVFEAIVCGSEVALSETHSAHDAFAREVIAHETSDWAEEVAALRQAAMAGTIDIHFFNGLQDPQVPPGTLDDFQRDHPWINFHVYPDAGQLLFFLKWREVLDLLDQLKN